MLVLHVCKAGSYIPMTWVINNTSNWYYFEVFTEVDLWRASIEEERRFIRENPEVNEHFMSRLLTGLSGVLERMEHLIFEFTYHKTILLLLYYVKNFSGHDEGGEKLMIPLTHKEIAAWIGTIRETASVQIELLKKRNPSYITGDISSSPTLSNSKQCYRKNR